VASYRLSVNVHSRAKGHSATAAAAYRAAERVHDVRTGEIHDYSRKSGVLHAEIVVPAESPAWAKERAALWNAAEASESRKNSCVARDFVISLPVELNAEQRQALALTLAAEIAERHHCAVDVALHRPDRHSDERNFHAHLLCSTRRLGHEGFTEKTRELDDRKSGEIDYWRERWCDLQNERLKYYGHDARVDHRSLKDQGIEREPTRHHGPAIAGILERGERSHVAERCQEEANERLLLAHEMSRLTREQQELSSSIVDTSRDLAAALRERDHAQDHSPTKDKEHTPTLDEQRAEAWSNWLAYRDAYGHEPDDTKAKEQSHHIELPDEDRVKSRTLEQGLILPDDDFSL
jgi:ATP-dependent exoDNAse (exonuclease V) alpha subunit